MNINRYTLFFLRETKNLIRVKLNENSKNIAMIRFSTPEIGKSNAYLHNVEVAKSHRNLNIGSRLLGKMDTFLKMNYPETELIQGVLWDDQTNPYLQTFFKKNGYSFDLDNHSFYDDQEDLIIDVIPILKKLYRIK